MKKITFINGKFVNHNKAFINVEDRGLLFSDSIYELISVFDKKIVDLDLHLKRLFVSLKKIKLNPNFSKNKIKSILKKLSDLNIKKNGYIYIQVTRGVSERKHEFPKKYKPSLIIFRGSQSSTAMCYQARTLMAGMDLFQAHLQDHFLYILKGPKNNLNIVNVNELTTNIAGHTYAGEQ